MGGGGGYNIIITVSDLYTGYNTTIQYNIHCIPVRNIEKAFTTIILLGAKQLYK